MIFKIIRFKVIAHSFKQINTNNIILYVGVIKSDYVQLFKYLVTHTASRFVEAMDII